MSRYARKLEKMESGKWFMKSVVLLGSGILCMVLLELLGSLGSAVGVDFLEAMAETLSGGRFPGLPGGSAGHLYGDGNLGVYPSFV